MFDIMDKVPKLDEGEVRFVTIRFIDNDRQNRVMIHDLLTFEIQEYWIGNTSWKQLYQRMLKHPDHKHVISAPKDTFAAFSFVGTPEVSEETAQPEKAPMHITV